MRHFALSAAVALLLVMSCAGSAQQPAALSVERPWARASVLPDRPGAAYLTIVNRGDRGDRLHAVTSPAAGHIAVHATTMAHGTMTMSAHHTLEIKAGERIEMKPGEWHLMLMDLRQPLREGETIPLTLRFERAGDIQVLVPIRGAGATSAD